MNQKNISNQEYKSKYKEYAKLINSVANKYNVLDPHDVESIKHDCLWQALINYDDTKNSKFSSFLFQNLHYAFRTACKQLKQNKERTNHNFGGIPARSSQTEDFVYDILDQLPEFERKLLINRYIDGISLQQLSDNLSCNIEAVRSHLLRARNLAKKLC